MRPNPTPTQQRLAVAYAIDCMIGEAMSKTRPLSIGLSDSMGDYLWPILEEAYLLLPYMDQDTVWEVSELAGALYDRDLTFAVYVDNMIRRIENETLNVHMYLAEERPRHDPYGRTKHA